MNNIENATYSAGALDILGQRKTQPNYEWGLTISQLARILNISERRVKDLIGEGGLAFEPQGYNPKRIRVNSLLSYFKSSAGLRMHYLDLQQWLCHKRMQKTTEQRGKL